MQKVVNKYICCCWFRVVVVSIYVAYQPLNLTIRTNRFCLRYQWFSVVSQQVCYGLFFLAAKTGGLPFFFYPVTSCFLCITTSRAIVAIFLWFLFCCIILEIVVCISGYIWTFLFFPFVLATVVSHIFWRCHLTVNPSVRVSFCFFTVVVVVLKILSSSCTLFLHHFFFKLCISSIAIYLFVITSFPAFNEYCVFAESWLWFIFKHSLSCFSF